MVNEYTVAHGHVVIANIYIAMVRPGQVDSRFIVYRQAYLKITCGREVIFHVIT